MTANASTKSAPVKLAGRAYLIEFSLVIALYVGAVLVRPWLIAHAADSHLVLAAKLLPVLPIWLMLVAVWRHYRRIDEFARLRFLETVAIAFGVGSCAIVSYAFLVDAGLPELALTWAWPTLAASWGITSAIFSIVDRP
jgi:hypothetical protein